MHAKSLQSCLILCNTMDCSPPSSSVHGDSPGKNTGVDCYALPQRNFPTQGLNSGLPHCRQTLYRLRHQGSHHEKASVRPPYLSAVSVSSGPQGFPGGSGGKESSCNVGDLGSIPGSGRSPGEGNGNPLQYSCLENLHGQRT